MVAFVQVAGSLSTASGQAGTITIPVSATTTAGNVVIAWVRQQANQSVHVASVSDTQGNSWHIDADHLSSAYGPAAICSAVLGTALVPGNSIVVTLAGSGVKGYRAGAAGEFSGLAVTGGSTAIDLNYFTEPGGGSASPSAGPSAQATELVISYAGSANAMNLSPGSSDPSSGGSWSDIGSPGSSYVDAAWQVATATSSFSETWTVNSSTVSAGIISYKAVSPPPPAMAFEFMQAVTRAAFY